MKNIWWLSALPAVGLISLATITPAQATEVVMLGVAIDPTSLEPVVDYHSSSSGAPAVANKTPAAQAIADLLNDDCLLVAQVDIELNSILIGKGGLKLADPRPSPVHLFTCP